jgi:hypothetical protein
VAYPHHVEVDSVEEAVALAESFRARDEYDIFRGQVVDWPMRATFTRLAAEEREEAAERFLEFAAFVERTPELAAMRGDRFAVMAVAQHYGFPTVLVDFTTDPAVAGWFASHDRPPDNDRPGVIYLAHREVIEQQYRDALPQLHTIAVDVANLWRLQAQSGLFLHLPFSDPEIDAWLGEAFGTIRFPYRGPMRDIPEAAIYPDRKSRLEILFDGFTSEEKQRRVAAGLDAIGMRRVVVPGGRRAGAGADDGWTDAETEGWAHPPAEVFRRQDDPPVLLLDVAADAADDAALAARQKDLARVFAGFLADGDRLRAGFVTFRVRVTGSDTFLDERVHPDSPLRRTVAEDLADGWDGMRLLPYPDAVLCDALAYLATAWTLVHGAGRSVYDATESLLRRTMLVELGLAAGGQHAMAPVPEEELAAAMREELLADGSSPMQVLHHVPDPRRAFDFGRFAAVFGRYLVPGQFLLRQRDVIFFSPARIERLGNR